MSDDAYGATVAKRRLSRRLTELRRASGHTANHVCDLLNWGRGKVGRFEANHWKRPEMSDIRDLLRVYGVGEAERGGARGAGHPGAGQALVAGLPRRLRERVPRLRERRQPDPGLHAAGAARPAADPRLRRGVLRAGSRPPAWRRRALEARLRRQEILDRTDGTAPAADRGDHRGVADVPVGHARRTGASRSSTSPTLSRRPNIELRIQRFADGPPPGMHSMVNIFDLPGRRATASSTWRPIRHPGGEQARRRSSSYVQPSAALSDAALEPDDTTAYLKQLAEQLE